VADAVSETAVVGSVAMADAWRLGLAWRVICDEQQVGWIERSRGANGSSVWCIGRQRGKSFAAITDDVSFAIEHPDVIIRYAAKTKESAAGILFPTLKQVLATCPVELWPKKMVDNPDAQPNPLTWDNGSTFWWAGTDAQSFSRLRGPRAHRIRLDECAFYQDLQEVEAALLPQLTTTGGQTLYLSTPPESPAHDFVARYRAAQATGRAEHGTIHDNPRLGAEGVRNVAQREADRLGLTLEQLFASTYWRREYLAEIVIEEMRAACPQWEANRAACVGARERPLHFDAYVSQDFGFLPDPTGQLFGWYDVESGVLVIEEEAEHFGKTIKQVTEHAKSVETKLYGVDRFAGTLLGAADLNFEELPEWLRTQQHRTAPRQPFLRVADAPLQTLAEISGEHGYALMAARKADKRLAVDTFNDLVRQHRVLIHPRCVRLIEQCATTLWDTTRSKWERSPRGDHGDLFDCAVYMAREVRWNRDPRPPAVVTDSAWRPPAPTGQFAALTRGLSRR